MTITENTALIITEVIPGKHLNWIDGGNKKHRLTKEAFEAKYLECFGVKLEAVA